ncbi:Competence protein ComM [Serratia plymuthica]|jgi:magnesium chelatase family protein|nr:Competence protein ComM [Serratia plymuthica]
MLASRLNGLLPPLTDREALESVAVASLLHHPAETLPWRQRPFRAPHHSASMVALVGGGSLPRPGEISMAHNGVLFLDELPEFERRVLDALREPLESGEIVISRASAKVCFPARVQLIAAMNPSPTGHYQGMHNRASPQQVLRYLGRLSGPFLDRFDLSIEVPLLPPGVLSKKRAGGESSIQVRERVLQARERQLCRAGKINALLSNPEVERDCTLSAPDADFLETTLNKLGLSVRAWQRILKVARTLADLAGDRDIDKRHLSEALGYRCMDRLLLQLHRSLE